MNIEHDIALFSVRVRMCLSFFPFPSCAVSVSIVSLRRVDNFHNLRASRIKHVKPGIILSIIFTNKQMLREQSWKKETLVFFLQNGV